MLAILLLNRGEVVSMDRLVDELWGERPPGTATKTVQVYVSRLRKELGEDSCRRAAAATCSSWNPANSTPSASSASRATGAMRSSEARRPARASYFVRRSTLWRGPPLADLAYEPFAQSQLARLEELRLVTLEHRIEADLALGRHAALIPELETLVREHPARERLRAQLILALYRSGRQADALASYHDARRALLEELGIEPSRELQELERAILAQDPEIDAPARTRPGARWPGGPARRSAARRGRRVAAGRRTGGRVHRG